MKAFFLACMATAFLYAEIDWNDQIKKQTLRYASYERPSVHHKHFGIFLERAFAMQSDDTKDRIRGPIFEILERQSPLAPSSFFQNVQVCKEIALFCGQKEGDHDIASLVDRTTTVSGEVALRRTLLPTSDKELLKKRQAIIRYFLKHPDLMASLQNMLKDIAQHEPLLISFWLDDPMQQPAARYYFNYPFLSSFNHLLNEHYGVMLVQSIASHQGRFGNLMLLVGAATIPWLYQLCRGVDVMPPKLSGMYDYFKTYGDRYFNLLVSLCKNENITSIARWITTVVSALGIKPAYDWAQGNLQLMRFLQMRLMSVRSYIDAVQRLLQELEQYPDCPLVLAGDSYSESFYKLNSILQSQTFHGKPSCLSHHGKVLASFALMPRVCADLERMIAMVSEVDMYLSCAMLFKEHAHGELQEQPFCFVQFVSSDSPVFLASGVHSIFENQSVPFDLVLKKNNVCPIVSQDALPLSEQATAQICVAAVICAQTFGIAPASSCSMTLVSGVSFDMGADRDGCMWVLARADEPTLCIKKECLFGSA